MKIGIINMQYSRHNYGALLQAAALQTAIENLHPTALVQHVDIGAPWQSPRAIRRKVSPLQRALNLLRNLVTGWPAIPRYGNFEVFEDFRNEYIRRTPKIYISDEDYATENWDYDAVVVGSDQVFRAHYVEVDWQIYFLSFLPSQCRRIAYAASFGVDHWEASGDVELTENVGRALSQFTAISVREQSGVSICRKQFGVSAEHVLDPTLMIGREYFDRIIENEPPCGKESAMPDWAVHLISNDASYISDLPKLARKMTRRLKNIYYDRHERWPLRPVARFSGVPQWLSLIRGAKECVFTDSYHCVCFCILFRKEFLVFLSEEKGTGRMFSLLKLLGLEGRICTDRATLKRVAAGGHRIDYEAVELILDSERSKANAFLERSLA